MFTPHSTSSAAKSLPSPAGAEITAPVPPQREQPIVAAPPPAQDQSVTISVAAPPLAAAASAPTVTDLSTFIATLKKPFSMPQRFLHANPLTKHVIDTSIKMGKIDEEILTRLFTEVGNKTTLDQQTVKQLWNEYASVRCLPLTSVSRETLHEYTVARDSARISQFLSALDYLDKLSPQERERYSALGNKIHALTARLAERFERTGCEQPSIYQGDGILSYARAFNRECDRAFNNDRFNATLVAMVYLLRVTQYQCDLNFKRVKADMESDGKAYIDLQTRRPTQIGYSGADYHFLSATYLACNPAFPLCDFPLFSCTSSTVMNPLHSAIDRAFIMLGHLQSLPEAAMPPAEQATVDTFIAMNNAAKEAADKVAAERSAAYTKETAEAVYHAITAAATAAAAAKPIVLELSAVQRQPYYAALAPHLPPLDLCTITVDYLAPDSDDGLLATAVALPYALFAYARVLSSAPKNSGRSTHVRVPISSIAR